MTDKQEAHREGNSFPVLPFFREWRWAGWAWGRCPHPPRGLEQRPPGGWEEACWGSAGCVLGESGGRPPGPRRGSAPPRRLTLAQLRLAPGKRLPEGSGLGVWVCGEHGRCTGAGALAWNSLQGLQPPTVHRPGVGRMLLPGRLPGKGFVAPPVRPERSRKGFWPCTVWATDYWGKRGYYHTTEQ